MNKVAEIMHVVGRVRTAHGDYEVDLFLTGNGGGAQAVVQGPSGQQSARDVWVSEEARAGLQVALTHACGLRPRALPVRGAVD